MDLLQDGKVQARDDEGLRREARERDRRVGLGLGVALEELAERL
jgi:hypothetical protein